MAERVKTLVTKSNVLSLTPESLLPDRKTEVTTEGYPLTAKYPFWHRHPPPNPSSNWDRYWNKDCLLEQINSMCSARVKSVLKCENKQTWDFAMVLQKDKGLTGRGSTG